MIEFSDLTLIESHGSFKAVKELMGSGVWMLETTCVVTTFFVSASFVLHFWHDGRVCIMRTNHPTLMPSTDMIVPDDDIRELRNWCEKNGWQGLNVSDELVHDSYDFWLKLFRSGIVNNDIFVNSEKEELERLKKATS